MKQSRFTIEGQTELGSEQFPLFVNGEAVGPMLIGHFRSLKVRQYLRPGRVRVTIELLNE